MPRAPKPRNDFTTGPAENDHSPRFTALVGDEYLESDDDLTVLLALLADLADPDSGEDVVCWRDNLSVAAIVFSDGRVIRYDRHYRQQNPTPTDNGPQRPQKG
jgi:hypothetical protein